MIEVASIAVNRMFIFTSTSSRCPYRLYEVDRNDILSSTKMRHKTKTLRHARRQHSAAAHVAGLHFYKAQAHDSEATMHASPLSSRSSSNGNNTKQIRTRSWLIVETWARLFPKNSESICGTPMMRPDDNLPPGLHVPSYQESHGCLGRALRGRCHGGTWVGVKPRTWHGPEGRVSWPVLCRFRSQFVDRSSRTYIVVRHV